MRKTLNILFFLCLLNVEAQDSIMLKNGKVINCIITSIDMDKVTYSMIVNNNLLNGVRQKNEIRYVHFTSYGQRSGQDFIFRNTGEIIVCKIQSVSQHEIQFIIRCNEEDVEERIAMTEVKNYTYNISHNPTAKEKKEKQLSHDNRDYSIRLEGAYGLSYRTSTISRKAESQILAHYKKLHSGATLHLHGAWFFSEYVGVGVGYSRFRSYHADTSLKLFDRWKYYIGKGVEDQIFISSVAPSVILRVPMLPNKRLFFISQLSPGYTQYVHNSNYAGQVFEVRGESIGYYGTAGIDVLLTKELALGFNIGGFNAQIKEVSTNEERPLLLQVSESLGRFDVCFGLRLLR